MSFDDRVGYLLLGVAIGFLLGYFTRGVIAVLKIQEEVHEVHEIVVDKEPPGKRDESGVIGDWNWDRVSKWGLFLVVILTTFASFRSQIASNHADEALTQTNANQKQLERVVGCIIDNQADLLDTINGRTGYTQTQAQANKKLQEAQRVFFGVLLHIPPYTQTVKTDAARDYQKALDEFLDAANASETNSKITKYPEADDLLRCIREEKSNQ